LPGRRSRRDRAIGYRHGGPYLLAVDAGTGSCRALLFTVAGEQAAVSLRDWQRIYPRMLDLSEDGLLNPLWWAAGS
jgi:hypothetical protein